MAIQNAELYQAQLQAERLAAVGEGTKCRPVPLDPKNILQAAPEAAPDAGGNGACAASNITQAAKGWRIVHRNLDKIYGLTMNLLAYRKQQREPQLEMINPARS